MKLLDVVALVDDIPEKAQPQEKPEHVDNAPEVLQRQSVDVQIPVPQIHGIKSAAKNDAAQDRGKECHER